MLDAKWKNSYLLFKLAEKHSILIALFGHRADVTEYAIHEALTVTSYYNDIDGYKANLSK